MTMFTARVDKHSDTVLRVLSVRVQVGTAVCEEGHNIS